jgi:hypothetical protein
MGTYGMGCNSTGDSSTGDTGNDGARPAPPKAPNSSSFFPTLGGGDGVVCNVDVDSTGLVVCDPSDLLEADESSPSSFSFLSSSRLLARTSLRPFARRSSQSMPLYQTASSLSSAIISSVSILATRIAGSVLSAWHSMITRRTMFVIAGNSIERICFWNATYACSQSWKVGGTSARTVADRGWISSPSESI